jgi:radical SAM PhpK family P-methyltransferase
MKKTIDCFIIGQNQISFQEFEQSVRARGVNSCAYRDLAINTFQHNDIFCTATDMYNMYCCDNISRQPIKDVEAFNAGIAYIGSYLHRRGFSFDFVNSFRDEKDYLKEKLEHEDVFTIAILTTHYLTTDPITEIIKFIKKYNQKAKIAVGGPFIANVIRLFASSVLNHLFNFLGADFFVNSSQGEAALVKLISSLKHDLPLNKINNIYYKTDKGFESTSILREDNNLSENMVIWDLFSDRVGEFVDVRTAISCPFSCSFCAFPLHAGKYRTADVEAVEAELKQLNKIKSVKAVSFIDDTFNIPGKRFKKILRMMLKNKFGFKWHSYIRCQFVDSEMVELMKESGCEGVFLGVESGNDQILKNMNKAGPIAKCYEGIALLKKYGIITVGNFIIGFPGETDETVGDTIEFIKKSGVDFRRTQSWYYDHSTPIAAEKDKYMMEGQNFEWNHKTMNSQRVCDIIEEIILTLEEPVRWPMYHFEWTNILQLNHKGVTFDKTKKFLKIFDNGVKEKLRDPSRKEVSPGIIEQIKESCK